jgi:hypothetical protein
MGMTVDIDIGGTGLGNIDDEEVDSIEDVEEVEAVEVIEGEREPMPPQKTPPSVVKKSNPWVKRIMVLGVVIVLIVVALFAFIYFGTKITDIRVGLSEDESNYPDSLKVTALAGTTGSASVAGEGNLEVTYSNKLILTSKINFNDEGTGVVDIPYNSFVEGNGNYEFQVEYKGIESPPETYTVDYVVERMNITAEVSKVNSNGQLNVTFFMLAEDGRSMSGLPKGHELTLDLIKGLDDGPIIVEDDEPEGEEIGTSHFRMEFPYSKSGNYTISASLINTRVKSDSDYYEITETRDKIYLNIRPIATATHVVHDPPPLSTTYSVDFDASQSWNDGAKTLYKWDFDGDGDIDEETTSPLISHDFPITINFDVFLNVEGDVYIWEPFDQEWIIEVGATTIHVNSP